MELNGASEGQKSCVTRLYQTVIHGNQRGPHQAGLSLVNGKEYELLIGSWRHCRDTPGVWRAMFKCDDTAVFYSIQGFHTIKLCTITKRAGPSERILFYCRHKQNIARFVAFFHNITRIYSVKQGDYPQTT